MTSITGSPCLDRTCYRGGVGNWNYQYKDGPCASQTCMWPWQFRSVIGWITCEPEIADMARKNGYSTRRLPARPHFTDTPATPIVDAGKVALNEALVNYP